MPNRRRTGVTAVTSSPSTSTRPASGVSKPGEQPERGGLAAAARAEQRQHLAPLERERDVDPRRPCRRSASTSPSSREERASWRRRAGRCPARAGPSSPSRPVPSLREQVPVHRRRRPSPRSTSATQAGTRSGGRSCRAGSRKTRSRREELGLDAADEVDERLAPPPDAGCLAPAPIASSITTVPLRGKT